MNRFGRGIRRLGGVAFIAYSVLAGLFAVQLLNLDRSGGGYGLAGSLAVTTATYAVLCFIPAVLIVFGFDRVPLMIGALLMSATSLWYILHGDTAGLDALVTFGVTILLLIGLATLVGHKNVRN